MAKTKDNLDWMRVYRTNRGMIEAADDAKVGRAFKLALRYFDQNGKGLEEIEAAIQDEVSKMLFGALKQGADDSMRFYADAVEAGRKGGEAKRAKQEQREKALQDQIDYLNSIYGGDEPTPRPPQNRSSL